MKKTNFIIMVFALLSKVALGIDTLSVEVIVAEGAFKKPECINYEIKGANGEIHEMLKTGVVQENFFPVTLPATVTRADKCDPLLIPVPAISRSTEITMRTRNLKSDKEPKLKNLLKTEDKRIYNFSSELTYCHDSFIGFDLEQYNDVGFEIAIEGWDNVLNPFFFAYYTTDEINEKISVMQAYQFGRMKEVMRHIKYLKISHLERMNISYKKEISSPCAKVIFDGVFDKSFIESVSPSSYGEGPENFKVFGFKNTICEEKDKILAAIIRGPADDPTNNNGGIRGFYFFSFKINYNIDLQCPIGTSKFASGSIEEFPRTSYDFLKSF